MPKKYTHLGRNQPKSRPAESIEIRVKSYYGKLLHTGKYDINNKKQLTNMFYYLYNILGIDATKIMREVKKKREKT